MTSSKMATKMVAILDFTKNLNLPRVIRKLQIFLLELYNVIVQHFALFGSILFFFSLKNGEKHTFLFKNGLT